jgi:hypothetical protein
MLSAEQIVNQQDRETRVWHHSAAGAAWPQAAGADAEKIKDAAGAKALVDSTGITARLKSCPDTERLASATGVDTGAEPDSPRLDWLRLVSGQHFANFELWHIEDEARAPGATDAELAAVKRRVDPTNQRRNDLTEGLDRALLAWLEGRGLPNPAAALHSETPGLMIDRLSILALKIYHTCEEAERTDASAGHTERNLQRLAILEEQRGDLAGCLDALWGEVLGGTRRFKLYRQLKMYNDPALNPAVYKHFGATEQEKTAGGATSLGGQP